MNCILAEGGEVTLISKEAVVRKNCQGNKRDFSFQTNGFQRKGQFTIEEASFGITYDYQEKVNLNYFNNFLVISTGLGFSWARIQIICPSTKELVFDSGMVLRENAACYSNENKDIRVFNFLDGNTKYREEFNCCPHGKRCSIK